MTQRPSHTPMSVCLLLLMMVLVVVVVVLLVVGAVRT